MKRADPFYLSPAWRALRLEALRRDRWRCVRCDITVARRGAARVNHIRALKARPDLALALDNLEVLCAPCDNKHHREKGRGYDPNRGCDATGNPLDPADPWYSR